MKYLLLSPIGLGLFLVPHLGKSSDVEKIYLHVFDSSFKEVGKDMEDVKGWEKLELVSEYAKILNEESPKDLVVIIDDVGLGQLGKLIRKLGFRCIGGSPLADRIEEERQFATDLMSRIMDVPKSTSFTSFDEAIGFIKAHDKEMRLIFKPNDSTAGKEYTYVAKDIPDMLEKVQAFRAGWEYKEDFQIQEFVKGVEVDFNAYFNGKEFIENSMIIYFEEKALMVGGSGPATGGSVAVEFAKKPEGVFWDILNKLKPALVKDGYVGQLAINSIVSEKDHRPYFLEFCGRFGYPSFPLDLTLVEDNGKLVHDLFMAMANGENRKDLFPTDKIGATISVFVPPAPNPKTEAMKETKGELIAWDKKWENYFWPYYVMGKKGKMVLAGVSSWVLQCTCVDSTLSGATEMIYKTYMPTLKLKSAMWRTDVDKSAKERIAKLREWKII